MHSKNQTQKQLLSTAYHEAGHAIAYQWLELPFEYVTIVGDEAERTLGHVKALPLPADFDPYAVQHEPTSRDFLERTVIMLFAGFIAEKRFIGRGDRLGATSDMVNAYGWTTCLARSERERRAYAKWLWIRTEELIEFRWPAVEALAAKLIEEKTISADRAGFIVYSDGRYPIV